MKLVSTLDVKTDGSLKVKRHTLVITNCEASSKSKEKIKGEEQPSSHPATIWEADDLKAETGSTKTLEIPENVRDFQHDLANGKILQHQFP